MLLHLQYFAQGILAAWWTWSIIYEKLKSNRSVRVWENEIAVKPNVGPTTHVLKFILMLWVTLTRLPDIQSQELVTLTANVLGELYHKVSYDKQTGAPRTVCHAAMWGQ